MTAHGNGSSTIACVYEIDIAREPLMKYRLRAAGMHRNVTLLEDDMLHGFARMFADPAAREVWPLRRRADAHLFLTLSGAFLGAGDVPRAVRYAGRSVVTRPASRAYMAALPWRRIRRAVWGHAAEPHLVETMAPR